MSTTHLPPSTVFDELATALDGRSLADQPLGVVRSLDAVARAARAAQLPTVLIDVLADRDQPEVARLRAFGRITAMLDASPQRPTVRPAA